MSDIYSNSIAECRAILIGVKLQQAGSLNEVRESVQELRQLAETAHIEVLCEHIQSLPKPNPTFFIGKGKVEELKSLISEIEADSVVFDVSLSPAQTRNLEKYLDTIIIDRTGLILEIFAQRARTTEAKLQVDIARHQYALPRLTRMWTHLSRQATGGGGASSSGSGRAGGAVRGVGETQLQIDRKLIRGQIAKKSSTLAVIERRRQQQRKHRSEMVNVSLVGYTNAGKSTLFNRLTQSSVLAEHKLFATLDPTTRVLQLPTNHRLLLTDTVGFIKKLPHELVASFKATLEEVAESDLLLHVVDASHPNLHQHVEVVNDVLQDLGADAVPVIFLFNKCDLIDDHQLKLLQTEYTNSMFVSAIEIDGLDQLLSHLSDHLSRQDIRLQIELSYQDQKALDFVYKNGQVFETDYRTEVVAVEVRLPSRYIKRLTEMLVHSTYTSEVYRVERAINC